MDKPAIDDEEPADPGATTLRRVVVIAAVVLAALVLIAVAVYAVAFVLLAPMMQ